MKSVKTFTLLAGCLTLSLAFAGCDEVQSYLSGNTDTNDTEVVEQQHTTTTTTLPDQTETVTHQQLDRLTREQAELNTRLAKLEGEQDKVSRQLAGLETGVYMGLPVVNQASGDADDQDVTAAQKPDRTIAELTLMDADLGALHQLLVLADMEQMLASGRYTLLAPSNQALQAVPKSRLDALRHDKQKLREVLMNHLIDRPLSSSELVQLKTAATLYGGHKLSIVKGADGKPVIQKTAKVIRPNLWASNGMVQVIDHFLIPAEL